MEKDQVMYKAVGVGVEADKSTYTGVLKLEEKYVKIDNTSQFPGVQPLIQQFESLLGTPDTGPDASCLHGTNASNIHAEAGQLLKRRSESSVRGDVPGDRFLQDRGSVTTDVELSKVEEGMTYFGPDTVLLKDENKFALFTSKSEETARFHTGFTASTDLNSEQDRGAEQQGHASSIIESPRAEVSMEESLSYAAVPFSPKDRLYEHYCKDNVVAEDTSSQKVTATLHVETIVKNCAAENATSLAKQDAQTYNKDKRHALLSDASKSAIERQELALLLQTVTDKGGTFDSAFDSMTTTSLKKRRPLVSKCARAVKNRVLDASRKLKLIIVSSRQMDKQTNRANCRTIAPATFAAAAAQAPTTPALSLASTATPSTTSAPAFQPAPSSFSLVCVEHLFIVGFLLFGLLVLFW